MYRITASLKRYFNVLKRYQQKCRFTFITGVTRVAHVSLFSTFNNLKDITLNERYASLLGITDAELHQYFDRYVQNAASVNDLTSDEVYERMKARYDGFRFTVHAQEPLYSPWSVLSFLQEPQQGFGNYWWGTARGVPTVLVHYLRELHRQDQLEDLDVRRSELVDQRELESNSEPDRIPLQMLMLQAGIYTLRYEDDIQVRLECPNEEVEESMLQLKRDILGLQLTRDEKSALGKLALMVNNGDIAKIAGVFNLYLNASLSPKTKLFGDENDVRDFIYAGIPEGRLIKYREKYAMLGRTDMELVTASVRMVIEFKRSETDAGVQRMLREGLNQIKDQKYGTGQDNRKLIRACMVISEESRGITAWADADAEV